MDTRYTFIELFSKDVDFDKDSKVKVSSVVIPQIQRPYAQGRTDDVSTYVRNSFLEEIFGCLLEGKEVDLNFIYGIIKQSNDEYKMELLDGQQRITTLFLFYWYVINAELDYDCAESEKVRDCLCRFVYETRSTSTVFCHELAKYKMNFAAKSPKDVITKSKWYFKSYDRDSTIAAMLTMLDAIHDKYTSLSCHDLYEKLDLINFYVKSLGVYNLSEELYIKMNARGLQLTPFENFKADLTNFVSNCDAPSFKEKVPLYKDGSDELVPFDFNFSIKLDAKWVDLFWKNGAEDFDDSFMSFFSRFFSCKYIVDSKGFVSDRDMRSDETIKTLYTKAEEKFGKGEYFGFKTFETLLQAHPEYIITLNKVLDVLYEYDYDGKHLIYSHFLPAWEKTEKTSGDDFYNNVDSGMSHVKLIALASVIEFVDAMPTFDEGEFDKWMRVVWNVIENTNIDSLSPVSSLIRKFSAIIHFIAEKEAEGHSFYKALSMWADNNGDKENRAVIEEVEKATRIAEDNAWEVLWREAELHPYFKGMVTFFYSPDMTMGDYKHSLQNAIEMFDKDGVAPIYRKKHVLIRAIVSCYNTWTDLNELYITERAETHKYLKNILAAKQEVRDMLSDVLREDSYEAITSKLNDYIDNAEEAEAWHNPTENVQKEMNMAVDNLRHNIKLYDWMANEEAERKTVCRFYWFTGHFQIAVPSKVYARIPIDTERSKVANKIVQDYDFQYENDNQRIAYDNYAIVWGSEIWLNQEVNNNLVWVGFCADHELRVGVACQTKKQAKIISDVFEGSSIDDDGKYVYLPSLEHREYKSTYKKLSEQLDELLVLLERTR